MVFLLSGLYTVEAQQVVKKDTLKGTVLTQSMDARILKVLTDLEENCSRGAEAETAVAANKPEIAVKPKTTAEICRDNPRILGYKIQVAVVKSNEEANRIKAEFRSRFPSIKAETDASLRPNYKILVGSYLSRQSAAADLARIKALFPEALPVQYRVFCIEAK